MLDVENYEPSEETKAQLIGTTFVGLIGPSGIGKNTISEVMVRDPRFAKIVSSTTREPIAERGEVQGNPYFFAKDQDQALSQLRQKVDRGAPVQVAAHPTLDKTYYYSELDQWLQAPYVTMDVLTGEYPNITRLPLLGSFAIVITTRPDEYLDRFYAHNRGETAGNIKKRLVEAAKVYNWALGKGEAVTWLSNLDGAQETAGKFAVAIATQESDYFLNDLSKNFGEELLKTIDGELRKKP